MTDKQTSTINMIESELNEIWGKNYQIELSKKEMLGKKVMIIYRLTDKLGLVYFNKSIIYTIGIKGGIINQKTI